jgi:hypothetical protein
MESPLAAHSATSLCIPADRMIVELSFGQARLSTRS